MSYFPWDFTFFEIVVKMAKSWLHSSCSAASLSPAMIFASTSNSNQ